MIFQKLIEDLQERTLPFTVHFITADADMFAVIDDGEYIFSADEKEKKFYMQDAGSQCVHLNVTAENYMIAVTECQPGEREYTLTHKRHCEKPDQIVITFLQTE